MRPDFVFIFGGRHFEFAFYRTSGGGKPYLRFYYKQRRANVALVYMQETEKGNQKRFKGVWKQN
jgi:hypothetical protein